MRTWVEYGFKQCKDKLGWADYRVTHYAQIERWWEIVSSAYLMVSLQFNGLNSQFNPPAEPLLEKFRTHACWQPSSSWTSRFHNLTTDHSALHLFLHPQALVIGVCSSITGARFFGLDSVAQSVFWLAAL